MTTYFGVLEGRDDNWGVWFPDVPGCVAAGNTAEEAIENAKSALALFDEMDREEGLVSPVARAKEELLKDPDVRDAISDGDRLLPFEVPHFPADLRIRA